jgi:hypothetical protein
MISHFHRRAEKGWRLLSTVAMILCISLVPSHFTHGANAPNEDSLKAAFLFNFAQFTRWPNDLPANHPIKFCLYRQSLVDEAEASFTGKAIGGRTTAVEAFDNQTPPEDCNVVYIAADYGLDAACSIANHSQPAGILTVSDSEGFDECGGHITLTTINNRLRFIVRLEATRQSKLSLSAQLLELAIVR